MASRGMILDVEKPSFLTIFGVPPGGLSVELRGDATGLGASGATYRVIAPPGVDPTTGALSKPASVLSKRADNRGCMWLWSGFAQRTHTSNAPRCKGRYVPPQAGHEVSGTTYGAQGGINKLGSYYCWNRTYDVFMGRWTTPDPAASPWTDFFDYCGGQPTQRHDESGLSDGALPWEYLIHPSLQFAFIYGHLVGACMLAVDTQCPELTARKRQDCRAFVAAIVGWAAAVAIADYIKAQQPSSYGWPGNARKVYLGDKSTTVCSRWSALIKQAIQDAIARLPEDFQCKCALPRVTIRHSRPLGLDNALAHCWTEVYWGLINEGEESRTKESNGLGIPLDPRGRGVCTGKREGQ